MRSFSFQSLWGPKVLPRGSGLKSLGLLGSLDVLSPSSSCRQRFSLASVHCFTFRLSLLGALLLSFHLAVGGAQSGQDQAAVRKASWSSLEDSSKDVSSATKFTVYHSSDTATA